LPPVDAGSIYSEIRIKLDKLTGDIKSVNSEFDKLATGTTKTEEKVTKGFDAINLAGVAAFAAISAGIKSSIDAFSKFEDAMAQVRTTATGTEQDFAKIEQATLKLGSSTDFTTQQIAEAQKVFNKFGDDASTSLELLAKSMVLANAKSADLAFTADLLRTTLSQFGLATDQADRLINVFAASKVPLEDIKSTLQTIGPVVAGMGISIEEVVATIKLLGEAGIDGGAAGSSLRLVLSDLGDTTSALSKKLITYGIDLSKVNPQTHTFAQIVGELGKAGLETSDVMSIFGARAGNAMVAILGEGQKAIEDYTASITGTNEAARQSAIMDNTLADATKTMGNAFEVAGVSLVKEFAPAIRAVVDIVTKGLQLFIGLPGPVKLFLGIAGAGIPVIIGLSSAFGLLAGLVTASAAPIIAVVGGIAAIVAIGSAVYSSINNEANITRSLNKSSSDLSKTLAELKKVKEDLTDKNKKLNKTEQDSLDIQRQKLEIDKKANLKKVIEDYSKYDSVIKKNSENIAINNRYLKDFDETNARFIKNTGKADATITKQAQSYKDLNIELKNKNILIDQDKQKTAEALALQVKNGEIALGDIVAYNRELGNRVAIAWTNLDRLEAEAKKTNDVSDAKIKSAIKTAEQIAKEKELAEIIKKANAEALKSANDYFQKTQDLIANDEQRIGLEQDRAIDAVNASDASAAAKQKEIDAINAYYAVLRDISALEEKNKNEKEASEETKRINEALVSSIESGVTNLISSFANLFSSLYDERLKQLDAQMQAELEAAGVAEDTAVEKAQKELDLARASGDQEVITEKEKALKKAQIEADYEKKKAQLQYEAAHAQWQMSLLSAVAQGAIAMLNAWNSMPFPFNLVPMGIAGVVAGVNVAAVVGAEPKPPSFETGGIVPGEQFSGDHINARLNSKEMVINQQQQAALWNFIRNGSRGNGDININNQFGDVRSDVDMERTSRKMARQVAGAQRSR
jgi:TP901 family phage tail tape measure protein